MTRSQGLFSLALSLMLGAEGYAQHQSSIPMQRNSYGLYTLETHVGRSVLFSGNPDADPVPFIIDTGASHTAAPRLIAQQLADQQVITLDQVAHGITGQFDTDLIFVEHLDCIGINRNITGCGEQGEKTNGHPYPGAKIDPQSEENHHRRHQEVHRKNPPAMMTVIVHRGRPKKLEGPGQAQQTHKADLPQVHSLLTKMDRKDVVEHSQWESFGEIQDPDPKEF